MSFIEIELIYIYAFLKGDMMNNDDFVFLRLMNELNKYARNFLPNFPKKEKVLKENFEQNLYDMFECIIAFNIQTTFRLKEKALKDFLIKLGMIDIYVKDAYHLKLISSKQMKALVNKETELKKICYALMKGLKKDA